mgnify:CR=1 FL=1
MLRLFIMKIFGFDLQKFAKNPTNVLLVGVVLIVAYNLYQNAEGFSSGDKKQLVLYYLPNCGFCKDMMPESDKVEQKHEKDPKVDVKKVNCGEKPEEAETLGISGFPTIILFQDGKRKVFDGERTQEGLEGFLSDANMVGGGRRYASLFNKMDSNKDGRLSVREQQVYYASKGHGAAGMRRSRAARARRRRGH